MGVNLDPDEEYVVMPLSILERILRYAMVVCQEHCPAGRDPATCPYIVNLTRQVGLSPPPCINDYGEYRPETFRVLIKDLERKYGMGIEDFVNMVRRRKPRSLEEQADFMEATFYLGVLRELSNMKSVYITRGSNISIKEAVVVK